MLPSPEDGLHRLSEGFKLRDGGTKAALCFTTGLYIGWLSAVQLHLLVSSLSQIYKSVKISVLILSQRLLAIRPLYDVTLETDNETEQI